MANKIRARIWQQVKERATEFDDRRRFRTINRSVIMTKYGIKSSFHGYKLKKPLMGFISLYYPYYEFYRRRSCDWGQADVTPVMRDKLREDGYEAGGKFIYAICKAQMRKD